MVLIIGNIDKAVINTRCVNDLRVSQCEGMLDAISLATKRRYAKTPHVVIKPDKFYEEYSILRKGNCRR